MTVYDPTRAYEIEHYDVAYRRVDGVPLLARVYRPRDWGHFPALVDVHGGAWSGGTRENNAVLDERLAATGLVVVAFDFRLAPEHPYPAQVDDVNYATRWVKARARDLRADVSRLGGVRTSSGGHTLMLSAMRPADPRYATDAVPEAADIDASLAFVILGWPVLDPHARYLYAKEASERLATATEGYFRSEAAMLEGNPTLIVERGERVLRPPLLIVQGTADDNIPMTIPERFVAAWRGAGGSVELELFPGMPHAFIGPGGAEADRAVGLIEGFVARQLAAPVAV